MTQSAPVASFPGGSHATPPPTPLPQPVPETAPDLPHAWTEHLLGTANLASAEPSSAVTWALEAQRFATALALASLFGVAIGLRLGGASIATHALGVSVGILAVCGLAVPALAILLALANASIDALGLARATSRAAATAGLLLAGFAPGAALFAVTVEDAISVTLVGASVCARSFASSPRSSRSATSARGGSRRRRSRSFSCSPRSSGRASGGSCSRS